MDSTPSKKIKLRPLLSSIKRNIDVVVMEATTKSFSALSTPNNLKSSTGRNNVKISSKRKVIENHLEHYVGQITHR